MEIDGACIGIWGGFGEGVGALCGLVREVSPAREHSWTCSNAPHSWRMEGIVVAAARATERTDKACVPDEGAKIGQVVVFYIAHVIAHN